MLLDRPGEVLTREELRKRVWDNDTYVDFDHSLNISINKLRDALGDSATRPRFIETLPRRGYRFIAPVSVENPAPAAVSALQPTAVVPPPSSSAALASRTGEEPSAFAPILLQTSDSATFPGHSGSRHRARLVIVVAAAVIVATLGGWLWRGYAGGNSSSKNRVMLAVLPFEDLAPDRVFERLFPTFDPPNDLVHKSDGALYSTDPPFGLPKFFNDPRKELPYSGVFRVSPDGANVQLVTRELSGPNGLAFSLLLPYD